MAIFAESALLPAGWASNVRLEINEGSISTLEVDTTPVPGDERHAILLPGMPNVHSHAFQRAMAGLAETRGPGADSFWSWREIMYRFALAMTPDQVEAVAAQLYVEMLEAGFTRVGEFHYLHHHLDGRPYANPAEMAERIAAAANETGIGLTLLPVFYAHSTFGGQEPTVEQRRFVNDLDGFEQLLQSCHEIVRPLPRARVGIAPHSLRAVTPNELAAVAAMADGGPIHIHVAEQEKEVADCLAWSGARPVEWLLDHAAVDGRWCVIHATHITAAEITALAGTGATVGLCPITEANLGDGIFPAKAFAENGGRFGVGSDSNILIGVADELRQLEYSQRLALRARNVLSRAVGSTGRSLFDSALAGGHAALGETGSGLALGAAADFVALRPSLGAVSRDPVLDAWIFAKRASVESVWVGGKKQVQAGRHLGRDRIFHRFQSVMRELLSL